MSAIISFVALILLSLAARFFTRKSAHINPFITALRIVPALCAVLIFSTVFLLCFVQVVPTRFQNIALIAVFFSPLIILGLFLLYHLKIVRKTGASRFSAIASFIAALGVSVGTVLIVVVCTVAINLSLWRTTQLPTSPQCSLEMKRKFAMCPEFDRRIRFKSGKTIGIFMDTCGHSDFDVYELKDGRIYIEDRRQILPMYSFIIDPKTEKVFDVCGKEMYELKGGLVSGRWNVGGDVSCYDTYGDDGGNEKEMGKGKGNVGNFKSKKIPLGDALNSRKHIGVILCGRFSGA